MKIPAWKEIKERIRSYGSLRDQIDTDDAEARIRNSIWFRGPNVYILAFSIIIASVGLNVNSTAVIIGAMLISPLMGPIIGMGLSLGINDTDLLLTSLKNLLVMMAISLVASSLFFALSPLSLLNPTELEARTSPTIYDVLIAFFGGLAGILENSRKERGTVLSGVAIATALMPPLCTAGYGIANWNAHFFFGAMYLFVINGVFIILATYLAVKYLRFKPVSLHSTLPTGRRSLISVLIFIVIAPSIWTAVKLVGENNFERKVIALVEENRLVDNSYIYDYRIQGRHVELFFTGEPLDEAQQQEFLATAANYGIDPSRLSLRVHSIGISQSDMNRIIQEIYDDTEMKMLDKDMRLELLQERLDSLEARLDSLSLKNQ